MNINFLITPFLFANNKNTQAFHRSMNKHPFATGATAPRMTNPLSKESMLTKRNLVIDLDSYLTCTIPNSVATPYLIGGGLSLLFGAGFSLFAGFSVGDSLLEEAKSNKELAELLNQSVDNVEEIPFILMLMCYLTVPIAILHVAIDSFDANVTPKYCSDHSENIGLRESVRRLPAKKLHEIAASHEGVREYLDRTRSEIESLVPKIEGQYKTDHLSSSEVLQVEEKLHLFLDESK